MTTKISLPDVPPVFYSADLTTLKERYPIDLANLFAGLDVGSATWVSLLDAALAKIEHARHRELAARHEIARLRAAVAAAIDWRGLDGDGITDPTRTLLIEALAEHEVTS